jgi:multicomponent K+:H+ antiporter subunit D
VQYIAFNLVGSALFLLALGVVYAVTGTLNMADLAGRVASLPANDHALIRAAAVMMIMVFAIKGALVPFQFWLPGTYANAPGPIAAMFAIMTKVGAYATIRMMTLVFVTGSAAMGGLLGDLLFVAGLATIVLGAVGVLAAKDLARMVAFAAIGSMGSVFLAISAMTPQATVAALYMMVHSTLATAMLFLVTDLILARRGHVQLTQDRPIPHQGLIGALFILACVAMVGMPPFSGFIAKLLVMQAWRDEAAMVWSVLLVSTLITMIGMARAGSVLFWKSHSGERVLTAQHPHIKNVVAFVSVAVFAAMLVGWTVGAGPITIWLMDTAQALHAPAAYIAAHQLPGVN